MDRLLTSSVSYSRPEYYIESRFRSRRRPTRRKHSSGAFIDRPSLPSRIHYCTFAAKITRSYGRMLTIVDILFELILLSCINSLSDNSSNNKIYHQISAILALHLLLQNSSLWNKFNHLSRACARARASATLLLHTHA